MCYQHLIKRRRATAKRAAGSMTGSIVTELNQPPCLRRVNPNGHRPYLGHLHRLHRNLNAQSRTQPPHTPHLMAVSPRPR